MPARVLNVRDFNNIVRVDAKAGFIEVEGMTPYERLIEPEEVADFVAYLCAPTGGVFTGATLTVDLGWTAR